MGMHQWTSCNRLELHFAASPSSDSDKAPSTYPTRCHTFEMHYQKILSLTVLLAGAANAQFQFFENMFGGQQGGPQQQQQGNAPSDSNWYQQNWDQGKSVASSRLFTMETWPCPRRLIS